jgi:hypothetical protein
MASDVIRLICPNLKCRSILCVPGSARGKSVRCRQCGTRVKIPANIAPKPAASTQPTQGEVHDRAEDDEA